MQRHGQQCCRGKHPPAKGGVFDCRHGQQRKADQIGQPSQRQRRDKAQMQHKGDKDRSGAGQIQNRVLVGLGLLVFSVAVKAVRGQGEQIVGVGLPGPDGGTVPIFQSSSDRALAQRQASVKDWLMWYFSSGAP